MQVNFFFNEDENPFVTMYDVDVIPHVGEFVAFDNDKITSKEIKDFDLFEVIEIIYDYYNGITPNVQITVRGLFEEGEE